MRDEGIKEFFISNNSFADISSVFTLEGMEYIKSKGVTLEKKKMTSYSITKEGKEELEALRSWLRRILEA